MFLDLALDVALHRLEVRVAYPVRGALHSAGDLVGHLRHLVVLGNADGAVASRPCILAGPALRALPKLLGALLELVGERRLQLASTLADLLPRLADLPTDAFRRCARAHRARRAGEGGVGTLCARPEAGLARATLSAGASDAW